MLSTIFSFSSLYFATLLMLIGTGLFNTYMGLTLTAKSVNEVWIGSMIAGYYLGLVCGARLGHKLIIRVGHIRAFVACAAVATSMILLQAQIDYLPIWLLLRLVSGIMMVTEFMVIESWLNEQTENRQRGRVFSVYMVVSGLGTVLGQLALTLYGALDDGPLILVAMCLVLCLVPIAVTARSHPPTPRPAPLDFFFFVKRVPLAMTVLFVAGNLSGAFYGLAPVYAAKHGLQTSQVALFVAVSVTAGLLSQWPIGWLSDRVNRAGLIRLTPPCWCCCPR
ncbi:transporter, major facilitator family protein [Bordetella hinzii 5132]|nr:transporter, major facilitator family protein [Bordetella hinzii 5132]